jgi:hypothetical protein
MAATFITLFNIIAPQVFGAIAAARRSNPEQSYREVLVAQGIRLDAEQMRLMEEMEQAIRDGAVPHS